jgi:type II secretory pathway pseudopilin PulG
MVVVAIIAIITSLAMPSLQESRKAAAASQAVGTCKITVTVSEQYQVRFGRYPVTENDLVSAGLLPDANNSTNSGYNYSFTSGPYSWEMHANPKTPGVTGDNYFFVDQSGVIRFSTTGPADAASAAID